MKVAVIGAGRVGTAVAVLLDRAGHVIVAVSGRAGTRSRVGTHLPGVPVVEPVEAASAAPDDLIAPTADELGVAAALGPGAWVMHLSGSLGLDVLAKARESGARCLALHPLQTFPDVRSALERIPGCWIAITAHDDDGHLFGERLVEELGGVAFRLADELRPLYHTAAVFASNYVVAASAVAGSLFAAAGVPDPARAMAPLQRASLENVERLGPAQALTGPAVRGDAGTIRRNLEALEQHAPELIHAYVALARATLDVAERSGRLAAGSRAEVEDVLAAWK